MSNIIDSIQLSGVTYGIKGSGGTETIELTQAQYDALVDKDPNVFYIITDAQAGDLTNYYTKTETDDLLDDKLDVTAYTPTDLSNYYTKSETSGATQIQTALNGKADTATTYTKTEVDNAITAATSTKQDTLVSSQNIKTINNESILGSGNIDIQGGGKAIEAGRGISITTGETADTVSFNLPIYSGGNQSIKIGQDNGTLGGYSNLSVGTRNSITGENSIVVGSDNNGSSTQFSAIFGYNNTLESYKHYCVVGGQFNKLKNSYETSFGNSSSSKRNSYNFGDSGNTLFTIGNGYDWSKTHNALEVRQNGDVYIVDTSDTSTTNYYQKPMIKLQDALGGGGGTSYSAGTGIDITNDVISVTGKVDTSTYNTYTAATDTALASKQTTLTAGTGISIVDNVISATGGSSITIDSSLDSGSTNAVANSAITQEFRSVAHFVGDGYLTGVTFGQEDEYPSGKLTLNLQQPQIKADGLSTSVLARGQWLYVSSINGKRCFSTSSSNVKMFNLVETSAITTSITSSSTDAQVPSAKAVNDKLGGLSLVKLTQAEYDALATKDNSTLYVIIN